MMPIDRLPPRSTRATVQQLDRQTTIVSDSAMTEDVTRPVSTHKRAPARLHDLMDQAIDCITEAWPDGSAAGQSLQILRDRLQDARFHLAVLGQFKRGKSTFINALLRAVVVPTAAVPLTAVPTFIAWAPTPSVRVSYLDGRAVDEFEPRDIDQVRERLADFVTEEGNPANRRRVARVDAVLPADILRDGVVLIDTPGIGSTLLHNTGAALAILPECDAALFIMSADPPITEAETAFRAQVRAQVVRLFFVLNKIDYLDMAEQNQVEAFIRRTLRDVAGTDRWSRRSSAHIRPELSAWSNPYGGLLPICSTSHFDPPNRQSPSNWDLIPIGLLALRRKHCYRLRR